MYIKVILRIINALKIKYEELKFQISIFFKNYKFFTNQFELIFIDFYKM